MQGMEEEGLAGLTFPAQSLGHGTAARRRFWKDLSDLIYTLCSIITFIADWQDKQKNIPRKARNAPNFDGNG